MTSTSKHTLGCSKMRDINQYALTWMWQDASNGANVDDASVRDPEVWNERLRDAVHTKHVDLVPRGVCVCVCVCACTTTAARETPRSACRARVEPCSV
jgi:hypothetical protein